MSNLDTNGEWVDKGKRSPGPGQPAEEGIHDIASRHAKAAKILAILSRALGPGLAASRCLDVGCASGLITRELAPHVRWAIGLEYALDSVRRMDASGIDNLIYVRGDGTQLPLPDEAVDLVLCAQVYEHVDDAEALVAEIARVLRPGGVCFFSGPNRLDPIERHYGLPFVSWLPRRLADLYLRVTKRGIFYQEHPRTYWGLRRLWQQFTITDYTLEMLRDPDTYHCTDECGRMAWVGRRLPGWLLRLLRPLYPNYNWVLVKSAKEAAWP